MAAKRRNKILSIAAGVIVLAAVLITISESIGLPIPSWNAILDRLSGKEEAPASGEIIQTQLEGEIASVHIIDVGQGDSVLIRTAEKSMLIDAGERDKGMTVTSYLKEIGLEKLDYVLGTHPHSDHMGGMADVLNNTQVGEVLVGKVADSIIPTTKFYLNFLTAVEEKSLPLHMVQPGEVYILAKGVTVTILAPKGDFSDLNNSSVICRLDAGNRSFLFGGDIETQAEEAVMEQGMNLNVDVLHLPHHGSNTSTGTAFFQAASPQCVSVSVGEGNSYGHPHTETLRTVEGLPLYRTDLHGTIVFQTDGEKIKISTQKNAA